MSSVHASYFAKTRARRALEDEVVTEMVALAAPPAAVHFAITVLLGHAEITYASVSQRVRQAKERRQRLRLQKAERPRLKARCLAAYHATCAYCDRTGADGADPDGRPWNLDRIFPGAMGGEYEPSNVALACDACNQKKGRNITFMPPPSLAQMEAA